MPEIDKILADLRLGKVIAYPSEGVWGLGCDPNNKRAVLDLLKLKHRPQSKGLILVGSKLDQMSPYIDTEKYKKKLMTKWPGPHTWVVPTKKTPSWIKGQNKSVALRVSSHPVIVEICDKFGGAIVSTSANQQGKPPLKTKEEVRNTFSEVSLVDGSLGDLCGATPIKDIVTNKWIRDKRDK